MVAQYPYFAAARTLLAKVDQQPDHIRAAAARVADRHLLRRLINSQYNPNEHLPSLTDLDIQAEDANTFERLSRSSDLLMAAEEELSQETVAELADTHAFLEGNMELPQESADVAEAIQAETTFEEPVYQTPEYQADFLVAQTEMPGPDTLPVSNHLFEDSTAALEDSARQISEIPDEGAAVRDELAAALEDLRRMREGNQASAHPEIPLTVQTEAAEQTTDLFAQADESPAPTAEEAAHTQELRAHLDQIRQMRDQFMAAPAAETPAPAEPAAVSSDEDQPADMEAPLSAEEEIALQRIRTGLSDIRSEYAADIQPDDIDTFFQFRKPKEPDVADASLFDLNDLLDDAEAGKKKTDLTQQRSAIDRFLAVQDKIDLRALEQQFARNQPEWQDLAADSEAWKLAEEEVTENFARIFERQGRYAKAIELYVRLQEMYPEKKEFYATQIEHLNGLSF